MVSLSKEEEAERDRAAAAAAEEHELPAYGDHHGTHAVSAPPLQPPPFSALTPVAAPDYTHTDYLPVVPVESSGHAFDPSYGQAEYVPAPPYGDFTNHGSSAAEITGDYTLQKGDYPYYAHKVAGDAQHSYLVQSMQPYPSQELYTGYSL